MHHEDNHQHQSKRQLTTAGLTECADLLQIGQKSGLHGQSGFLRQLFGVIAKICVQGCFRSEMTVSVQYKLALEILAFAVPKLVPANLAKSATTQTQLLGDRILGVARHLHDSDLPQTRANVIPDVHSSSCVQVRVYW